MAESPTVRTIAKQANVSPSTVSQVLNNKGRFKEATRVKVLKAASQLGYKPDSKRSQIKDLKRLAIVFPPHLRSGISENHLYQELYEAIMQRLSDDVSTLVVHNDTGLFPLASALDRGDLNALIALGASEDHPTFGRLHELGIPALAIMRQFAGSRISWVSIDHRKAAYDATSHLIRLGHRRIAFAIPYDDTGYVKQRIEGYHAALEDAGIPADLGQVHQARNDNAALIDGLFKQKPMPTAVFASPDTLAAQVIARAKSEGLRVPDDLAVVGFDNLRIAQECSPTITTIGFSRQLVGQTAIDILEAVLKNGLVSMSATIPHQLIVRESCGGGSAQ